MSSVTDLFGHVKSSEPSCKLLHNWTGQRIVLRCTGGIGDALITIGGVAHKLKEKDCFVVAAVREEQVGLISKLTDIDYVVTSQKLNDPAIRSKFDVILELSNGYMSAREIKNQDYYDATFEKIGLPTPGIIGKFEGFSEPNFDNPTIAIHAGSSNPIRRWPNEYWRELAYKIRDRGIRVIFMGTEKDFGFEDNNISCAWNHSKDLIYQANLLSTCCFFIGNDSGFAHIAGLLYVPGTVLFSATVPEHVIGKYENLIGIDKYEEVGCKPSRSLRNSDENALICMNTIQVDEVFLTIPLWVFDKAKSSTAKSRIQINKSHKIIFCVNEIIEGADQASALKRWFETDIVKKEDLQLYLEDNFVEAVIVLDEKIKLPVNLPGNPLIIPLLGRLFIDNLRKVIRYKMGQTWPETIQKGVIKFTSQYNGVGDTIMNSSVLMKAREMFPDAKLLYHTKYSSLIPIDLATPIDDPDIKADLNVRLSYYDCWREGIHALKKLGGCEEEMILPLFIPLEIEGLSVGIWPRQGANRNKVKEWDDEKWIRIASILNASGFTCYQLGGMEDRLIESEYIVDLRMSEIKNCISALNEMNVVIGIEGVASHACRALNKSAIILWGGSCDPSVIGYSIHKNLKSDTDHMCWASVCQSTFKEGTCCGTGKCVNVDIDEVCKSVSELVKRG